MLQPSTIAKLLTQRLVRGDFKVPPSAVLIVGGGATSPQCAFTTKWTLLSHCLTLIRVAMWIGKQQFRAVSSPQDKSTQHHSGSIDQVFLWLPREI